MKFIIRNNHLLSETIRYLKLHPITEFNFYPGQYVEFVLNEKEIIPFSIANAPNALGDLEFFIRESQEDPILCRLRDYLQEHKEINVLGPHGNVLYHPVPNKPIILLAGGVGISQVKAILEQAMLFKDQRKFLLYWGMSDRRDLVLEDHFQIWKKNLNFNYKIIFTRPVINLVENESIGLPYQMIVQDFPNMQDCLVYSCGPWEMTDKALAVFLQHQLPRESLLSDRFAFT